MAITLSTSVGFRSSLASIPLAYGSANGAGALLTLCITSPNSTVAASTVTDSAGNLWTIAVRGQVDGNTSAQIWYSPNAIPSTNTITVANATGGGTLQCFTQEWAGCATTTPLLATSSHVSVAASTHTPGAVSPDPSTALLLAHYSFVGSFDIVTGPTGYTQANSTFGAMETYYKIVSGSTTTENPEAVSSATEGSINLIAAFSGSSGGAPATVALRRSRLTLLGVS
jgi:hypothetical protein